MSVLPHEFTKRSDELSLLIKAYIREWNSKETAIKLSPLEDGGKLVAYKYFEILHSVIKVYLPESSNANKFKVASGTELACMFVLPIRIDDPNVTHNEVKRINAQFAISAAQTMLFWIYFDNGDNKLKEPNANIQKVYSNHTTWLHHINRTSIDGLPTLLNSNFWEAYLLACAAD